ncbi:universal stress protein [Halotalea alkalilenta]|uniref:Universal stress protein n=1 Tax=Halotalea alkalilenta TaxID=376489 RepID=A0A172YBX1_9GAMM|nr:universal stress protein [Halotalea alkalilenta]ANF56727.1 universal stress protein [Halotalea alkalilenta]
MPMTILLATDLSAECQDAFARAIAAAELGCGELLIAHVYDPHLPEAAVVSMKAAVEALIETQLAQACSVFKTPRPATRIMLLPGDPHTEIARLAFDHDVSLALLGTHRRCAPFDTIESSPLARLMRSLPCPVISVSHSARRPWQDLLVPVDFSLASRHTLKQILPYFPSARLTLLHAWDAPVTHELAQTPSYQRWRDQERTRLHRLLEEESRRLLGELGFDLDVELVVERGDPAEVLLKRIEEQPPDLLAMGNHTRLNVGQRHAHSLLERLIKDARCDLMICRTW